mgnify:CR=1 FL=1
MLSVESVVSRYEIHFNKSRQLSEPNAIQEMLVAENGPELFKADILLKRVMESNWKATPGAEKWHFQRTTNSLKTLLNESKTVTRL